MSLGVTIADFVESCRSREGRLPFEIGAFVALEMTEALLAQGPAVVSIDDTRISLDGHVAVYAPPHSASSEDSARSVVDVLAHLLVASGTGVPPVLLGLVERGPSDGGWELGRLRDELEASLVPLNRSAARRVLSRLLKETRSHKAARPGPDVDAVDADLDALLAGGEAPPDAPTQRLEAITDLDALDELEDNITRRARLKKGGGVVLDTPAKSGPRLVGSRDELDQRAAQAATRAEKVTEKEAGLPAAVEAAPSPARVEPNLDGFEEVQRSGGRGLGAVIAVLLLIGGGIAALLLLRPDIVAQILGNAPPPEEAPAEAPPEPTVRPHGALQVTAPDDAQILLFVGRGPATAPDLPIGVAHEFVTIADGRSPSRTVVPAEANWPRAEGGPVYELAMQTGQTEVAFEELELGETRLSRDGMGAPSGSLGTVRIVTDPMGARVFLVIGFGNARIDDLAADQPVELLVYRPNHQLQRIFVGPSDWTEGPEGLVAQIEANPEPR